MNSFQRADERSRLTHKMLHWMSKAVCFVMNVENKENVRKRFHVSNPIKLSDLNLSLAVCANELLFFQE